MGIGFNTPHFMPLPARSPRLQAALLALAQSYIGALDGTESDVTRILATSSARQAQAIALVLRQFEERGSGIFEAGKRLQLLGDMLDGLQDFRQPTNRAAQAVFSREALELRRVLTEEAPALGIDLRHTDFTRTSLALVSATARNSFSELSDFEQLQRGQLIALRTEVGEALVRGESWREIASNVEQNAGLEALPAIPGVRRAFSLQERGSMIARTEVVRIQTALQRELGRQARLTFGRSYLNWRLTKHHELCLWAESLGWAPIEAFTAGPGLPPRHPNCGCMWQEGLQDWVDPEEGPARLALQFAQALESNQVRVADELLARMPADVRAVVQRVVTGVPPAGQRR